MARYHPLLADAGVTVGALLVGGGLTHHGYAAMAVVRLNSLKERTQGKPDVHLDLDADWHLLSRERRVALIDHELEHIRLVYETRKKSPGFGQPRRDDRGRPKLRLLRHDLVVGGFAAVIERHGENALEVDAINACGKRQAEILNEKDLYADQPPPVAGTVHGSSESSAGADDDEEEAAKANA